jgi:hypothetical protein
MDHNEAFDDTDSGSSLRSRCQLNPPFPAAVVGCNVLHVSEMMCAPPEILVVRTVTMQKLSLQQSMFILAR